MKRLISSILLILAVVSLITFGFTFMQVKEEEVLLQNDLQYRTTILAESLRVAIEPALVEESTESLNTITKTFSNKERLAGLSIVDNKGKSLASSSATTPRGIKNLKPITEQAMDSDRPTGNFDNSKEQKVYVFALPLHKDKSVVGALTVVQNAGYIDTRIMEIWKTSLIRFFTQILVFTILVVLVIRWSIYAPLKNLVEETRSARLSKSPKEKISSISDIPFLRPLINEITGIKKSLFEARLSASEEARLRLEKFDSPWTVERLKEFVKDIVKGQTIIAVSNREPYIHEKKGDKTSYYFPASGVATAIEAIMQATGGEWIAHGSGSGDRLVVDKDDKIAVPPDDPKYVLKRVWLTKKEEIGYYYGFSNEGLWPLCHMVHNRPIFRKSDWIEYQQVNRKFADVVLKEIKNLTNPIIFIQDFHFALLPKMIKEKRPDAQVVIFWHIPWPNAESFGICPFRKEILDGLLGADIIGFHTQFHCNNFIDTVRRELESLINLEKFTVKRNNHKTFIKPFPISISFYKDKNSKKEKDELAAEKTNLIKQLNINAQCIGLGIDRLDYTKGIIERLRAVELFLEKYPEYINNFVFIQIGAPSRGGIRKYDDFNTEVTYEVERINEKLKTKNWKPIIFLKRHHSQEELHVFYNLANIFLVTSLHDGMNLVAKEFVAARSDEKGVLLLSKFAGAAAELSQALVVNPYNIEGVADEIKVGLDMKADEQTQRMRKMRKVIKDHNVYRWSAEIIKAVANLE